MARPDRHNEIEINYFPKGKITYLIKGEKFEVKENQYLIFWALLPHEITEIKDQTPFYVCTIPFTEFTQWDIPNNLKDYLLNENIILAEGRFNSGVEERFFNSWTKDLSGQDKETVKCAVLEIQAKLSRIFKDSGCAMLPVNKKQNYSSINLVEKIALFIAQNYTKDIKVSDVGKAVDLHPDYANAVFKKAFSVTIKDYLTDQRILHAQRLLSTTSMKVIDVAFDSGFNSLGRFNAIFKKWCDCTPKEYRRYYNLS